MKKFLIVPFVLFFINISKAQVLKRLGDRVKQRVEQNTSQKVDKTVDDAMDGKKNNDKKNNEKTDSNSNTNNENSNAVNNSQVNSTSPPTLESYSKYDFVPGEKVIAYEDFSNTEVGDFPTRWNTNATAEVVTLNNKEGKWLKISKEGAFHPEFITDLPDNFTLEFDLAVNNDWRGTHFAVNIAKLEKPEEYTNYYHYVTWRGNYAVHMQFKPGQSARTAANSKIIAGNSGNHVIDNDVDFKVWDNASKNFAHISMWRQGQRLRVYVNGEKIWDVPRAFDATSKFNAVTFGMQGSYGPDDYMLLGNIRLAVGAADTRNKLITEGKFVTRGILFDVNSDKIKPESYGALKDIANVLKENADVKVKIIGHTDSDGDDAKNLELSKRRATAVKTALSSELNIDASRMETDGMGETKPVADNTKPEEKAQNRRVEFVKL
jgi:outer membrane protein OmpA-like peptidoglycan-associated protein